MTAELQKLAKALDQIERRYPAGGKRYSTIIENPYEAGYMPFPRPEVVPESWTGRIVNPKTEERSTCQRNDVSTVPI